MFSKKASGIAAFFTSLAVLVLEILPFGAVLIFADGPDIRLRNTFSYFSLMPFGYGHIFPLITAHITLFAVLFSIISLVKNYNSPGVQKAAFICTAVALMTSVLSLVMLSIDYVSAVGVAISVLLLICAFFQAVVNGNISIGKK